MENSEIQVWLDFSLACKYLSLEQYQDLNDKSEEIGKLLFHIINNPEKYS
jgi:four helix bundle protein